MPAPAATLALLRDLCRWDQVTFKQPIHVGELATFLAAVNYTGTTSMEIGVKVITETSSSRSCATPTAAISPHGGDGR